MIVMAGGVMVCTRCWRRRGRGRGGDWCFTTVRKMKRGLSGEMIAGVRCIVVVVVVVVVCG